MITHITVEFWHHGDIYEYDDMRKSVLKPRGPTTKWHCTLRKPSKKMHPIGLLYVQADEQEVQTAAEAVAGTRKRRHDNRGVAVCQWTQ